MIILDIKPGRVALATKAVDCELPSNSFVDVNHPGVPIRKLGIVSTRNACKSAEGLVRHASRG